MKTGTDPIFRIRTGFSNEKNGVRPYFPRSLRAPLGELAAQLSSRLGYDG